MRNWAPRLEHEPRGALQQLLEYFLALDMLGDFSSRQANPGIEVSVKQ
jgi:hypothetical protein